MKKAISVLLALCMTSVLFSACGSGTNTSPAASSSSNAESKPASSQSAPAASGEKTGEKVELTVAGWDNTVNPQFGAAADAYMAKNPNVSIKIIDIPTSDYNTKLNVMLNANSDVDVYYIMETDTVPQLAKKGQMMDLSSYMTADKIDNAQFGGIADYFKLDNQQVALPVLTNRYVLYYNKELFDKAKVPYPTNDMTWTQFEELARKMTSGEGSKKVYGAHMHTWPAMAYNWAIQDGKHDILSTADGAEFVKSSYEMLLRLQKDGIMQDYGTLKTANIHHSSAFAAGNVAMIPMGNWLMSTLLEMKRKGEMNIDWGIVRLPHPEGVSSGWTIGSTTAVAINPKSTKTDTGWDFIKYLISKEGGEVYAKLGLLPSIDSDSNLEIVANLKGMPSDPEGTAAALQVENIVLDRPILPFATEVNQMLTEEHSLIMLNEIGLDEALAEITANSKQIQGK